MRPECSGIDIEAVATGDVMMRIGGSAGKWITDAVGTRSMIPSGSAHVGSCYGEWISGLESHNAVDLPSPKNPASTSWMFQNPTTLADWKSPGDIANEAVADIQRRVSPLGSHVIRVLWRKVAIDRCVEVGNVVAPCVAQPIGQTMRVLSAKRKLQSVVVGVAIMHFVFKESMLATTCQVYIGIISGIISRKEPLIGVPETSHLSSEVANIISRCNCAGGNLVLCAKARLLHITAPLIRVLRTNLEVIKRSRGRAQAADWEALTQHKHWRRAALALSELCICHKWRIQAHHRLGAEAIRVLVEDAVTST